MKRVSQFSGWIAVMAALLVGAMLVNVSGGVQAARIGTAPSRVPQAAFTPGNLVVVRVGAGAAALSNAATEVFLDEKTTSGAAVQSLALPTAVVTPNARLTVGGTASTEGALALSADGRYLSLAGYDASVGTPAVGGTTVDAVNRVVARVAANGTIDTTTRITDTFNTVSVRGAVTADGSQFWTVGGSNGVRYLPFGGGPTIQINSTGTNFRTVAITAGQLYADTSGAVQRIGTGLPTTSGQTVTNVATALTFAAAFVFLDRSTVITGVDTLYVADQNTNTGLRKFSFDGTTWTPRGVLPTASGGLTGIAGTGNAGRAVLYATAGTGAGNTLVTVTDSAAFTDTLAGTFTTLATAPANTVYRGLAFAPQSNTPAETPTPGTPTVTTTPGTPTMTTTPGTPTVTTTPGTPTVTTTPGTPTVTTTPGTPTVTTTPGTPTVTTTPGTPTVTTTPGTPTTTTTPGTPTTTTTPSTPTTTTTPGTPTTTTTPGTPTVTTTPGTPTVTTTPGTPTVTTTPGTPTTTTTPGTPTTTTTPGTPTTTTTPGTPTTTTTPGTPTTTTTPGTPTTTTTPGTPTTTTTPGTPTTTTTPGTPTTTTTPGTPTTTTTPGTPTATGTPTTMPGTLTPTMTPGTPTATTTPSLNNFSYLPLVFRDALPPFGRNWLDALHTLMRQP